VAATLGMPLPPADPGPGFDEPEVELLTEEPGEADKPERLEGYLHFELDSSARTSGEHVLEYGGAAEDSPSMRLKLVRRCGAFQRQVATFLRGYLHKEWDNNAHRRSSSPSKPSGGVATVHDLSLLPDVPQQETANDCGFFLLEQILRALQLSPALLRTLAAASPEQLAALPWPSQDEVSLRKEKLKEGLGALFEAAQAAGTSDVEVLLRRDAQLRELLRGTLVDSTAFADAVQDLDAFQRRAAQEASAAKRRRPAPGADDNGHSPA